MVLVYVVLGLILTAGAVLLVHFIRDATPPPTVDIGGLKVSVPKPLRLGDVRHLPSAVAQAALHLEMSEDEVQDFRRCIFYIQATPTWQRNGRTVVGELLPSGDVLVGSDLRALAHEAAHWLEIRRTGDTDLTHSSEMWLVWWYPRIDAYERWLTWWESTN